MNLWLIIALCFLSNGVATHVWAQKKSEEPVEAWDEKAFFQELEEMKDPFVAPFLKKNEEQTVVNPPKPVVVVQPVKPPVVQVVVPKKPEPSPNPVAVVVPKEAEFTFGNMQLNGVIWNTDLPQAIINDRIVSVGQGLNGAKITAITKEGLEVVHKGKRYILTIRTETEAAADLSSDSRKPAIQRNPKADMRRRVDER